MFSISAVHVCCSGSWNRLHYCQELSKGISSATWQIQPGCQGKKLLLFEKGISAPKTKSQGSALPCAPLLQHMWDWKINQVMDYSNRVIFFLSRVEKSLLFASGNDLCKLNPQQKMNEAVKPEQYRSLSFYEKKKKNRNRKIEWAWWLAAWGNLCGSSCSYHTA